MGRRKFRILIALIALSHLVAASELGAMLGFLGIWAMIIAALPLGLLAFILPEAQQAQLGLWLPQASLIGIGLAFLFFAGRSLLRANAARLAGDEGVARSRAVCGLAIMSVPSCFILSVKALADAWP